MFKSSTSTSRGCVTAGAFGSSTNPQSARIIGMIPPVPIKRTRFVGNTAIAGAKMALTSRDIQREARILAKQIRYLELAVDPDFREEYISALYLPRKYLRGFSIELYNRCLLKKYWVLFS